MKRFISTLLLPVLVSFSPLAAAAEASDQQSQSELDKAATKANATPTAASIPGTDVKGPAGGATGAANQVSNAAVNAGNQKIAENQTAIDQNSKDAAVKAAQAAAVKSGMDAATKILDPFLKETPSFRTLKPYPSDDFYIIPNKASLFDRLSDALGDSIKNIFKFLFPNAGIGDGDKSFSGLTKQVFFDCVSSIAIKIAIGFYIFAFAVELYALIQAPDLQKFIPFVMHILLAGFFLTAGQGLIENTSEIMRREVCDTIAKNTSKYMMAVNAGNDSAFVPGYIRHMHRVYAKEYGNAYFNNGGAKEENPNKMGLSANHASRMFKIYIFDPDDIGGSCAMYYLSRLALWGKQDTTSKNEPDLYEGDREFAQINTGIGRISNIYNQASIVYITEVSRLAALKKRVSDLLKTKPEEEHWHTTQEYDETIKTWTENLEGFKAVLSKAKKAALHVQQTYDPKAGSIQLGGKKFKPDAWNLDANEDIPEIEKFWKTGPLSLSEVRSMLSKAKVFDAPKPPKTSNDISLWDLSVGKIFLLLFEWTVVALEFVSIIVLGLLAVILGAIISIFEGAASLMAYVEWYIALPMMPLAIVGLLTTQGRGIGLSIIKSLVSVIVQLAIISMMGFLCAILLDKLFIFLLNIIAHMDDTGMGVGSLVGVAIFKDLAALGIRFITLLITDTIGLTIAGAIFGAFYWAFFPLPVQIMHIVGLKDTTNIGSSLAKTAWAWTTATKGLGGGKSGGAKPGPQAGGQGGSAPNKPSGGALGALQNIGAAAAKSSLTGIGGRAMGYANRVGSYGARGAFAGASNTLSQLSNTKAGRAAQTVFGWARTANDTKEGFKQDVREAGTSFANRGEAFVRSSSVNAVNEARKRAEKRINRR